MLVQFKLCANISRYLEVNLKEKNPRLSEQVLFMNTFFYERLCQKNKNGTSKEKNLEGILKWTAKIDLFKKNYIIIPINERYFRPHPSSQVLRTDVIQLPLVPRYHMQPS